jgi:hypothetical protein
LICLQKAPPSERDKFADLAFDRHARVIGDPLAATGQRIEQRSLAIVRRADLAVLANTVHAQRCNLRDVRSNRLTGS